MSHTIRLTGFWTRTVRSDGRIEYARKFGRPRTLDPHESAWLVGTHAPGTGELLVNGQTVAMLARSEAFEANITSLLQPRNDAKLIVDAADELGEIVLAIRS